MVGRDEIYYVTKIGSDGACEVSGIGGWLITNLRGCERLAYVCSEGRRVIGNSRYRYSGTFDLWKVAMFAHRGDSAQNKVCY